MTATEPLPACCACWASNIVCPQMIYPYLRAIVSDVCTRAGFPPIMLTEVNFQAMFEAQQAQAAGNGSGIITGAN